MKTPGYRLYRRARNPRYGGESFGRLPALTVVLALGLAGAGLAQEPPAPSSPTPEQKAPALPEPEPVTRVTSDGLTVAGTYYPSKEGENAVPVILLHSFKADGLKEYKGLAEFLQAQGHAVLVPDLRGHGQSTTFKATGAQLDLARMGLAEFSNMVTKDMEAWRGFLVQRNNDRKLNLNKLCVVGSELGASVAMHWALHDWNWLGWSAGKRKPSVKALVLLSPQRNFKGLDTREPLAHPAVRSQLSILILVGRQDSKVYGQASQLHTALAKYHPQSPQGLDEKAQARWDAENKDLFLRSFDTKLQGSRLLGVPGLGAPGVIAKFLYLRLASKEAEFPWQEIGKKP